MPIFPPASIDSTALLALVPIATAVVTGLFTWFVQSKKYKREASDKATQALRQNRDPLLRAAFDLQSRLYNVVARDFFSQFRQAGNDGEKAYARSSTLWLFGQYLGWREILRREVQFLDLGSRTVNRTVQRRLSEVSSALASDSYGREHTFIIFRSDQRAIGEFMVTERDTQSGKRPDCLGYSEFVEALAHLESAADAQSQPEAMSSPIVGWARRFTADMDCTTKTGQAGISQARLVRVQRRLIELIDLLDPDRLRYPRLDSRGKLPWAGTSTKPRPDQFARFVWPWKGPWDEIEAWAAARRLECRSSTDEERSYLGKRGMLGGRAEFCMIRDGDWFTICAQTVRDEKTKPVDGSLRALRARLALNDLLDRYDRPVTDGATMPARVAEWGLTRVRRPRPIAQDQHPRQDSNLGPSD